MVSHRQRCQLVAVNPRFGSVRFCSRPFASYRFHSYWFAWVRFCSLSESENVGGGHSTKHRLGTQGAVGFVSKELADAELVPAIRAAARGERFFSPRVAVRLDAHHAKTQRGRYDTSSRDSEKPYTGT
jgi:hypothetical protein